MLLEDEELNKIIDEIVEILMPKQSARFLEHLGNLNIKIEDLRKSRDKWREKYTDLKSQQS